MHALLNKVIKIKQVEDWSTVVVLRQQCKNFEVSSRHLQKQ